MGLGGLLSGEGEWLGLGYRSLLGPLSERSLCVGRTSAQRRRPAGFSDRLLVWSVIPSITIRLFLLLLLFIFLIMITTIITGTTIIS